MVRRQREAMLAQYDQVQDTRAGGMLREDVVAIHECGETTARIGIMENGDVAMYVSSPELADLLEPAVQNAQHVRTRIVPKVTRETLNLLPARDDDEDG